MNDTHFHIGMAILGAIVFLMLLCLGICAVAAARKTVEAWREQRAIARRDAARAKREADAAKWAMLSYPRSSERPAYKPRPIHVKPKDIDPARTTGQFYVSHAMRDFKGSR